MKQHVVKCTKHKLGADALIRNGYQKLKNKIGVDEMKNKKNATMLHACIGSTLRNTTYNSQNKINLR